MADLLQTPSGSRIHIAFLGRRNVGKSSLMNAFTAQKISIVAPVAGTTTDPVSKAMELLPLGPVNVIDTAGLDDEGTLGALRVEKTYDILGKVQIAILVADATVGLGKWEEELLSLLREKKIPHIIAMNKADLLDTIPAEEGNTLYLSAKDGININRLREKAAHLLPQGALQRPLAADLVEKGDTVVLVVPIDGSAPKGRLILPQQMVIRDLLEHEITAVCTKDTALAQTLQSLKEKPALVITDSQVFGKVSSIVPEDVPLTSFSILMARHKGSLQQSLKGAETLMQLQDGDKVLISEGCSHHRQCEDIGTVKIPNLIRKVLGVNPQFTFTSGGTFPKDLGEYRLIIHCGGCTLTEQEMKHRMTLCRESATPVTNYGMTLAALNGILERSMKPLAGKL